MYFFNLGHAASLSRLRVDWNCSESPCWKNSGISRRLACCLALLKGNSPGLNSAHKFDFRLLAVFLHTQILDRAHTFDWGSSSSSRHLALRLSVQQAHFSPNDKSYSSLRDGLYLDSILRSYDLIHIRNKSRSLFLPRRSQVSIFGAHLSERWFRSKHSSNWMLHWLTRDHSGSDPNSFR